MSSSFENVKNWIISSGLIVSDKNNENYGGAYSFFDQEKKEYGFLYPEITGYTLSVCRFLNSISKNDELVCLADASANWIKKIFDKYGAIIQGIGNDKSKQNFAYSFDTAICAKGLLDNFLVTKNESDLEYAKKLVSWIVDGALDPDTGKIKPYKDLALEKFSESNDVWYKQYGCLHLKIAMVFYQLHSITQDQKLLDYANIISNTYTKFQNSDGSILLHENSSVINLHTQSYAIEGLLYAHYMTKNKDYLETSEKAIDWCITKIQDDNSISLWFNTKYKSKAVYPIAQIIRIMILLDKLNNKPNYQNTISKLVSFLSSLQSSSVNQVINGAFYEEYYKSVFGWKIRKKLNSWGSMFALQALYWNDNYKKVTFDEAIEYIY